MFLRVALVGLALLLGACHDNDSAGSGTTPQTPPTSGSGSTSTTGTAKVVISFPLANSQPSALGRIKSILSGRPVVHSYVSAKTQGLSVGLTSVNGATPTTPV